MPNEAARCAGVVKIYWSASGEVHALKGVDAVFPAGAVTAVVGPSGSGKSSFLRILGGLDRPTAGSVVLAGQEVSGLSSARLRVVRRRLVGYVLQRPAENLVPYLTAREHLTHARAVRRARTDVDALLDQLGMARRARHRPHELSGGEQQRLAFAQAVVGAPPLLLADEPTAELDHGSAARVLAAVRELAASGVAVVLSTHDPAVVAVADRTLSLRHGAVEAETLEQRVLSVIDGAGRVQLPPDALALFPQRRAVLSVEDGEVRIGPP